MSTLILFAGFPGVGKSYASRILESKLNLDFKVYYYDSDKHGKKQFDNAAKDLWSLSDDEILDIRLKSQKTKIEKIKKLFNRYEIIILDTCFDIPKARKLYLELESEGVKIVILEIICDEEIVKKRIFENPHDSERMPGTKESRWDVYHIIKNNWKKITHPNHFVLNSQKNIESQIDKILPRIKQLAK